MAENGVQICTQGYIRDTFGPTADDARGFLGAIAVFAARLDASSAAGAGSKIAASRSTPWPATPGAADGAADHAVAVDSRSAVTARSAFDIVKERR